MSVGFGCWVCHCFAGAVPPVSLIADTASAKQWHTLFDGLLSVKHEQPPLGLVGQTLQDGTALELLTGQFYDPLARALPAHSVRSRIPSGHVAAIAGDGPLILQVDWPMVRQRIADHLLSRPGHFRQGPRLERRCPLKQQVPVEAGRSRVFEDGEAGHE